MAVVTPTNFSMTLLSGNRVRINLDFRVDLTPTESRLQIPTHVYVKLMERDGSRDETHLHGEFWSDFINERGDEDESASSWMSAGTFDESTTSTFTREFDRDDLPGETGSEEWYCVTRARPDIYDDVWYSNEIIADLN